MPLNRRRRQAPLTCCSGVRGCRLRLFLRGGHPAQRVAGARQPEQVSQAVPSQTPAGRVDIVVGDFGVCDVAGAVAVNGQEAMRGHPVVLTGHDDILAPRHPGHQAASRGVFVGTRPGVIPGSPRRRLIN